MRRRAIKALCVLIQSRVGDPTTGCEVGVWRGDASRGLLTRFSNLILLAVDPWDTGGSHQTLEATQEVLREAKKQFLEATEFAEDRRWVMARPSVDAAKVIAPKALDFVFIDAEHTYECVCEDIAAWAPKVRDGGLLCGHDYESPHDKKGIHGVKRAVDEYALQQGCQVRLTDGDIWWLEGTA